VVILGTSDISSTVGVGSFAAVPSFAVGPVTMILGTSIISSMVGLASLAVVLSFVTGSFVAMLGSRFDAFCPISIYQ
jgi:hypothetical protein